MKLISLNIWGGHIYQPLCDFFLAHRSVDIFCLQEVYHRANAKISTDECHVALSIFDDIQKWLPDHVGYFLPLVKGIYGLAMFVKQSIKVSHSSEVLIYLNEAYTGFGPKHSRYLQQLDCQVGDQTFLVINIHGLWNGLGKGDSADRLQQSLRIKQHLAQQKKPFILCGDFNLRPDTFSLKQIARGLEDLIKVFEIKDTRTSYYQKSERFADYMFTNQAIRVNDFCVLKNEVSDHAPLCLDFDICDDRLAARVGYSDKQ